MEILLVIPPVYVRSVPLGLSPNHTHPERKAHNLGVQKDVSFCRRRCC